MGEESGRRPSVAAKAVGVCGLQQALVSWHSLRRCLPSSSQALASFCSNQSALHRRPQPYFREGLERTCEGSLASPGDTRNAAPITIEKSLGVWRPGQVFRLRCSLGVRERLVEGASGAPVRVCPGRFHVLTESKDWEEPPTLWLRAADSCDDRACAHRRCTGRR